MSRLVRLLVGALTLISATILSGPAGAQSYEQAIGGILDQILGAINRRLSGQKVYVAEFLDEPVEAGCNPLSQSLKVGLLQLLTNARATIGLSFDLVESEAEAAGIVRGSWRRLDAQRVGLNFRLGRRGSATSEYLLAQAIVFESSTLDEGQRRCIVAYQDIDREAKVRTSTRVRAAPNSRARALQDVKAGESVYVASRIEGQNWLVVDLSSARGLTDGPRFGFVLAENIDLPASTAGDSGLKPASDPALRSGEEFDDCGNAGWCPKLRVVPPGRFEQGATADERAWYLEQGAKEEWANWEQPRHSVRIGRSFAMGKQEVTVGQFRRFVERTGHSMNGGCTVFDGKSWTKEGSKSWRDPGFGQSEDHPVVCVSWEDAKAYVGWLSRETGKSYRLPSESEWEYAARGSTSPTTAMRYWGDDKGNSEACSYANAADLTGKEKINFTSVLSCRDGEVYTARVSRYRANGFGLHDMLGNVWEWVEDPWHDSYAGAPADGSVWTFGGNLSWRVLRGGSWYGNPRYLRSANRYWFTPDFRDNLTGFRVARMLTP